MDHILTVSTRFVLLLFGIPMEKKTLLKFIASPNTRSVQSFSTLVLHKLGKSKSTGKSGYIVVFKL